MDSIPPSNYFPANKTGRRITLTINAPTLPNSSELPEFISLDVSPDMTLADFKASVEAETTIPSRIQILLFHGQVLSPLNNPRTLKSLDIKEDELMALHIQEQQGPGGTTQRQAERAAARARGAQDDVEMLRLRALGEPQLLQRLQEDRPDLAEAVHDAGRFRQIYESIRQQGQAAEAAKEEQLRLLRADDMNVEAQLKIEEMIRQERVAENLQQAMEHTPEGT